MLFFIDETWQEVGGVRIGGLGAVAIPQAKYNAFCREVFKWKGRVLRASELNDSELKGSNLFAKAAFRRQQAKGDSRLLEAANEMFVSLERHGARTFVVWTRDPTLLTLRNPSTTALSDPYKALLYDMRRLMEDNGSGRVGSLNFDQRAIRDDEATACAVQNFLVRTKGWWKHFQHVPNFTVSSVSPGLQAADMVAYLGACFSDETVRPELKPYLDRLRGLMYTYETRKGGRRSSLREIETRDSLLK